MCGLVRIGSNRKCRFKRDFKRILELVFSSHADYRKSREVTGSWHRPMHWYTNTTDEESWELVDARTMIISRIVCAAYVKFEIRACEERFSAFELYSESTTASRYEYTRTYCMQNNFEVHERGAKELTRYPVYPLITGRRRREAATRGESRETAPRSRALIAPSDRSGSNCISFSEKILLC